MRAGEKDVTHRAVRPLLRRPLPPPTTTFAPMELLSRSKSRSPSSSSPLVLPGPNSDSGRHCVRSLMACKRSRRPLADGWMDSSVQMDQHHRRLLILIIFLITTTTTTIIIIVAGIIFIVVLVADAPPAT